jgi:HSP20 family protein
MVAVRLTDKPFRSNPSPSSKFLEQLQSKGYFGFYPSDHWTPNVNLYETETAYIVCVDLSGVEKNKIDLEVNDGRLIIRGNRPVPTRPENEKGEIPSSRIRIHLMEIDHGGFARDVELPEDVIRDNISAKYHSGMLWIELPKKV